MQTITKPKRRRKAAPTTIPTPAHAALCPVMLDLMANFELQHGHHATAEHLARQAAAMREAAP